MTLRRAAYGGFLLCAAVSQLLAQRLSPADTQEILEVRRTLDASMRGPQSPLNMVALQKLDGGEASVGSATDNTVTMPHIAAHLLRVRFAGEQIKVLPPLGGFPTGVSVGGAPPAVGTVTFDADGTSPKFRQGDASFVLRHKFGYWLVGRDMQAPSMLAYQGLRWYPPSARYRTMAQWKPFPAPRTLRVANVLGQVNEETSYGVAEFTVGGHTVRLEPSVNTARPKPLFFVFRDSTSRTTTYGVGRFLDAGMPSNGLSQPGTVVLDFNQARNPWCAFSVHTSCPLPPMGNRLVVAIPAGERRYPGLISH